MVENLVTDPPVRSVLVGELYTTGEVARLCKVSQRTVQIWIRSGELPVVRYGRILRVRETDLAAFGEVLPRRTPPGRGCVRRRETGTMGAAEYRVLRIW
jgi:excisionase family DNA binding protein